MDPYEYINSFVKFGSKGGYKPGLKRIKALLKPFGHPENRLNIIHIAGSNGKGSTLTFLKQIYYEAGYLVGAYTSPHLLNFNERIEVNGRQISTVELSRLCETIRPVVEKIEKGPLGRPSFFEIVTTLAFLYFESQGIDLLLLEVGLGGRLDATNIIKSPLVSVITSISLEHTSILGNTPGEIAREKGGIIKTGRPVITAVKNREALISLNEIARDKGSIIKNIDDYYEIELKESSLEGQRFSLIYKDTGFKEIKLEGEYFIGLAGSHQLRNAVLALAATEELQEKFPVSLTQIKNGLKKAFIPGRLEVFRKSPLVIFDGAHNHEGMEILTEFLINHLSRNTELWVVLAVLKDKNIRLMLQQLKILQSIFDMKLIITKNSDVRALEPQEVKEIAGQEDIDILLIPELEQALCYVLRESHDNQAVCITGSLFTVAGAKLTLKKIIRDGINSKTSS